MALDIFFIEDIEQALLALDRANRRAMMLAVTYGMSAEAARLYSDVYYGALADVGTVFGLTLEEPSRAVLEIPAAIEGQWEKT